ncbi:hypothetical protein Misp01_49120 [Microtetraspora sp. NBRC 13810]|uniref:TIGR03086 family metal-binding protein n=1 Tax=Microtetraspora sp. NBRC 13810 TaxID=3030990 RepID=UPI0024A053E8|nr:TIGR03086 family metal-binding protein [Microtetraspora sp. NBRC 13810]GLW09783.1 hypothetical protein Misp01_49120 [Microtetraspora sp. NBRC 13810]
MHGDDTALLSIGELARRTGLSVKLIRHWSDIGVVPPAGRTEAGYRLYEPEAVARLELARTLRELGLGMTAIRDVVDRGRGLAEVAAIHADALEGQIRLLRTRQAVLRAISARGSTTEELSLMTRLARLSAAERKAIIHELVDETVDGLNVPTYRDQLLAATPDLPDEPTREQLDAWIELHELVRDPGLRAAMRRMAEYADEHAPGPHDEKDVGSVREVTDLWTAKVAAAMTEGIAADSATADQVVADVVAAWLPTQPDAGRPGGDGAEARRLLLEQLEMAADTRVERYWQLTCVINGMPVPPSLAAEGRWLITALRANPEPGMRTARVAEMLRERAGDEQARLPDSCARVLAEVEALMTAVTPDMMADPTPCAGWDVRTLLNHLVWENLMWTGLAAGAPRTDVFTDDHLGDDHVAAFRSAAEATMAVFREPGMLDREYGPAPGWRLVEQVVIEMLVHGWDLARAIGRPTDLAPDVAEAILPSVREIYGDVPRTPGGSFAPEHEVPATATPADRLAAFLGRDPAWRP